MTVTSKHKSVSRAIRLCLDRNIPFAAYRLPGGEQSTLIIQESGEPNIINLNAMEKDSSGFIFAPFHYSEQPVILINPDIVISGEPSSDDLSKINAIGILKDREQHHDLPKSTDRHTHIGNVNKAVDAIRAGKMDKVVLSRVRNIEEDHRPLAHDFFSALCSRYPHAFVSVVNLNGQTWVGASPEPLLCTDRNELLTVSLAGTRIAHESNFDMGKWGDKERWEQELVSRHIEHILHVYSIKDYKKNGPYITSAGNVLHLRTDYRFPMKSLPDGLPSIITALHPTPAVCGMDTNVALDFISRTEDHDRSYFTGFLGPLGIENETKLFVNLRCMRMGASGSTLYMGGGITRDSVAEDEWHETEIKSETLLSVIGQIG